MGRIICKCGKEAESTNPDKDWLCFECRDHSKDIRFSEIEIENEESGKRIVTGGFSTTSGDVIVRELEKTIQLVKESFPDGW